MDLPNPFGKYRLERELGKGATKTVWEAFDTVQERKVALKVYAPENLQTSPNALFYPPDMQSIEHGEAVAQTRAGHHPHIATIYDAGQRDGWFFIVEELIEGRTLADVVAGLPQRRLRAYARDICSGLRHLHRRGIVHGDLKLENIIVDAAGAHITDFGAAMLPARPPASQGSLRYRAPEIIAGQKLTPASDMWQLGVLLYRAVAGAFPFNTSVSDWSGATPEQLRHYREELKHAIMNQPFTPLKGGNTNLRDVIHSCLQQDPSRRMTPQQAALRLGPFGWWKELAIASALSVVLVPGVWLGMRQYAEKTADPADIIFTASEHGAASLYRANASLRPAESLSEGASFGLTAHPSGNAFSYVRASVSEQQLRFHTATDERVLYTAKRITQQAWSPDGTKLAALVETADDYLLVILGKDGTLLSQERGRYEKDLAWHPSGTYLTALANNALFCLQPGHSRRATEYPSDIMTCAWTSRGLLAYRPDPERPPGFIVRYVGKQDAPDRHELTLIWNETWGKAKKIGELRDKSGYWFLNDERLTVERWADALNATIINVPGTALAAAEGKNAEDWFIVAKRDGLPELLHAQVAGERVRWTPYLGARALEELIYLSKR
ncbi:MAG TPA: serine/threonine-protein kinase [Candidatus Binatia bacterium]|nr:serine/threonine-protein kinase [Candidatus Binatia bacterium]